jgi:small subunit ribosomal protein S2
MSDRIARLKKLAEAGVQFGHESWRLNPKMRPYIWGEKNGICLIDLAKTEYLLSKAEKFLEEVASQGKAILWVGTKRAAQEAITAAATETTSPGVTHRWIGGTLTNYTQVKKSITKLLHYEDVLAKSADYDYTKKEFGVISKNKERLEKNVGGLRSLTWPVGAVVVVDVRKQHVAVREAQYAGVPVVALVDTNCDPSMIDYVVPANDDAPRAVREIVQHLADAVVRGQAVAAERPKEEIQQENMIEQMLAQVERAEEGEAARRRTSGAGAGAQRRRPQQNRRPASRPAGSAPRSSRPAEAAAPAPATPAAE